MEWRFLWVSKFSHSMNEHQLKVKSLNKKLFLQIQSINIMYPNVENMIVVPITKGMNFAMGIQVCLISRINFDYKENGGKKALPANPKHQDRVSQC